MTSRFLSALAAALLLAPAATDACQVIDVDAGAEHSVALRDDGTVWIWGREAYRASDFFQSDALPSRTEGISDAVDIAAGTYHTIALLADGTVWEWGASELPVQVPGLDSVISVEGGDGFTLALRSDETVWAWGSNDHGQLGNGTFDATAQPTRVVGLAGVVAIAAGETHALAVLDDGTARAWGEGISGQLGDGLAMDASEPVVVTGLSGVVNVAAGRHHSLAVTQQGSVWSWGQNDFGQLGTVPRWFFAEEPVRVTSVSGAIEVKAGARFSLALLNDETVLAWGDNRSGQLGDPVLGWSNIPMAVPGLAGIAALAAGEMHGLALEASGGVRAWGRNGRGQLAIAPLTRTSQPWQVPGLGPIVAGKAGRGYQSAALQDDGTLLSWGFNQFGGLGLGSSENDVLSPQPVTLPAAVSEWELGMDHGLVLLSDGDVYAWGLNDRGQVGDGSGESALLPVPVNLPGVVLSVHAGAAHSLALLQDGRVLAWGANESGQLGLADRSDRELPVPVPMARDVVALIAGDAWSAGILDTGEVRAWGVLSDDGSVSPPTILPGLADVFQVDAGYPELLAVTATGELWSWWDGIAERESGLPPLQQVAAGFAHTVALSRSGEVWTWGDHGLEGPGDPEEKVVVPLPDSAVAVSAGLGHSLALLQDGTLWAWGWNAYGELGVGSGNWSVEPVDTGFGGAVEDIGSSLRLRLAGDTVELEWHPVFNAVSYNPYRAEVPSFAGEQGLGNTTDSTATDPAAVERLLYYRVAGVDCSGTEGP